MSVRAPAAPGDREPGIGASLAAQLPRPNLGPELPPTDEGSALVWSLLGLALLIGLAGGRAVWAHLRRRRRSESPQPGTEPIANAPAVVRDAAEARRLLARRFGISWLALTTEQISGRPELVASVGPEVAAGIVELLSQADEQKYGVEAQSSAELSGSGPFDQWAPVLAALRAEAAGASSTRTGR